MTATRPRRPVPRSPHRRFGGSPRRFAARAGAQRIKRIALRLIVSLTVISTLESTRSRRTCTRPPFGVNLTAFESRFHMTCCKRS